MTKNQTISFCSIVLKSLDSTYLFIDVDLDISATQIRQKLLEIYQLESRISFSREADFGHFWMQRISRKAQSETRQILCHREIFLSPDSQKFECRT